MIMKSGRIMPVLDKHDWFMYLEDDTGSSSCSSAHQPEESSRKLSDFYTSMYQVRYL